MNSFANYVITQPNKEPELPLVHTTEFYKLPDIRETNELSPTKDEEFKEAVLYFFYGRPAYRDPKKNTPEPTGDSCPICFVFRPRTISTRIKRIYPFDTGASKNGFYEPHLSRSAPLNTYSVPAIIESARRIISGFFDTNENYLRNKPLKNLKFGNTEQDVETYYKLITQDDLNGSDDRVSAIEIQIDCAADLSAGELMAVVFPTFLFEDSGFRETLLHVWKAQPLTYDADRGMRPTEHHGTVRQLIRKFYEQWRFV